MARIKHPDSDEVKNKFESLLLGALLEVNENENIEIYLKLDASLIESVIEGCRISFILYFVKGCPRLDLSIYDNENHPFFINNIIAKEDNYTYLKVLNGVLSSLKNNKNVVISIFNLNMIPVGTYEVKPSISPSELNQWLKRSINQKNRAEEIFEVDLNNNGLYPDERTLTVLNHIDLNGKILYHYFHDYKVENKESGLHGYAQEDSIYSVLNRFFKLNNNFFISPKYKKIEGEELIDFIILLQNTVVLIESKFIKSAQKRNINKHLKKAAIQLYNAQRRIIKSKERIYSQSGQNLKERISAVKYVVRLCVFNTNININEHINYLKKVSNEKDNIFVLPAFVDTITFSQFIGYVFASSPNEFEKEIEKELLSILFLFSNKYKSIPIFLNM